MLCMPHRKLKSDLMLCISPIKLSMRVLTKNTFSLSAAIKKGKVLIKAVSLKTLKLIKLSFS